MLLRFRSLVMVMLAIVGALAIGLTSTMTSAARIVTAGATLLADEVALIMGGSGLPIPPDNYVTDLFQKFMVPNGLGSYNPQGLVTPEGLYPLTGVKSLPLSTSAAQGVTILNNAIMNPASSPNPGYLGDDVAVLGYSQSAVISSLEMIKLAANPDAPAADQLSFVLLGDPMNPNGGLLERFEGLVLPSVGLPFYGATPDDTIYHTDIYTLEYDGYADFPRYPINLLADLNAFLGIMTVHGTYPYLTDAQIADAILLPGSTDYTGTLPDGVDAAVNTNYWMIEQEAPLVSLLSSIPLIGKPLADLLGPDLTILINLGYGNISDGWDPGPANLPTQFGLFPDMNWNDVLTALGNGAVQGWNDFIDGLSSAPTGAGLGDAGAGVADAAAFTLPSLTEIMNAISSALASAYGVVQPTLDILNAMFTSIPAYDIQLITEALQAGDLIGAIGNPIAADVGLFTMAAGFELEVIQGAISSIMADFSGLFS